MSSVNEVVRLAREWAAEGAHSKRSALTALRLCNAVNKLPDKPIAVWRYVVRPEKSKFQGWGIFLIDSSGMMTCVTDYGNYAFKWSSIGERDIRSFLCGCDAGYLTSKLAPDESYDGYETEKRIKEEICRGRRDGYLDKETARDEWDTLFGSLSQHDVDTEISFSHWLQDTRLENALDLIVCTTSIQIKMFCERLWPRLVAQLEQQL